MENRINVAELLRNCPKGMELDCTMFENVTFVRIDMSREQFPIEIAISGARSKYLTKEGCFHDIILSPESKCIIFPKGKTTWEGFEPPCKFKEGDVLFVDCADKESDRDVYKYIFILKEIDSLGNYFSYCHLSIDVFSPSALYLFDNRYIPRLATGEEKQKLFQAIKDNGYKWNPDNKTLDKLIEPKFKVGDKIRHKCPEFRGERIIKNCTDIGYFTTINDWIGYTNQDDWELVPNKFDIASLVPFESRVLVRDYDIQIWIPTFWGKYLKDDSNCCYLTTNGCYKYCIPYNGNEHLLGTTKDCDEFYKTWKQL